MKKRGLLEIIVLSIVTCGIYQLYWTLVTFGELAYENNENDKVIVNAILIVVTCGIWYIYMQYKIYLYLRQLETKNGLNYSDITTAVVTITILLGILSSALLLQDRINNLIGRKELNNNTNDSNGTNDLNSTNYSTNQNVSNTENQVGSSLNLNKDTTTSNTNEIDDDLKNLNNMFEDK